VAGTLGVGRAIIASAVTTAVVFVPALYLRHLAAALFRQLALAIMITLLASLCFALLALPVAAARLGRSPSRKEPFLTRHYRRFLARIMSSRWWTIPMVGAAIFLFLFLLKDLPQHLIPPETVTAMELQFSLPPETTGPSAVELADRMFPILASLRKPEEADIFFIGGEPHAGPPLPRGFWRLPAERRPEQLRRIRSALLDNVPGMGILRQGAVGGVMESLPLRHLAVELNGPIRPMVQAEADRLAGVFQKSGFDLLTDLPPQITKIVLEWTARGQQELDGLPQAISHILPLPRPLALGNLRVAEAAPVWSDLQGLPVALDGGRQVALGTLAGFQSLKQPPVLVRHGGEPAVRLLLDGATGEVYQIEKLLNTLKKSMPQQIRLKTSGGILDWQEARQELKLALILGLLLVFLVLIAIYESFRFPLVIFCLLPFALLGGVLGLKLTGQGLDLASGLGFILLSGLAVNNGVLLGDRLLGCPGGPARWSYRAAARLRPILVTTLTTLATLAPVAFMGGMGASLRATLALTVFSGLLFSTPAALFILPPLARLIFKSAGKSSPVAGSKSEAQP